MKIRAFFLALAGLTCTSQAAYATCYTVYDQANKVIYNAQKAPIDMSRQIHETLPSVFPGGHLVFTLNDYSCPNDNEPEVLKVQGMPLNDLISRQQANKALDSLASNARYDSPLAGTLSISGIAHRNGSNVHVSSYTRKDGSVVQSYDRASSGRGGGRR